MTKKRNYNILRILKSCVTGTAVWVYMGPSAEAARKAYWRACRHEAERMRQISKMAARRKANILQLLNDCMAGLPITAELPPEKKAAARQLLAIAEEDTLSDRSFYNHILETRRRRNRERKLRNNNR